MRRRVPVDRATAAAFALFCLAALTLAGPVAGHPGSRLPGDTTSDSAGVARYLWVLDQKHSNPFTNHRDPYVGAPEGIPISPALEFVQPLQAGSLWAAQAVVGRVAAINGFAFAGLLLSALALFLVARMVGLSPTAALLPAFVVPFGPWSTEQLLAGHLAFLHMWAVALFLGALVLVGTRRTIPAAMLTGAAGTVCVATAAYIGMIVLPLAAAALIVAFFGRRGMVERLWVVTLTTTALATTALLLVPALLGYLGDRSTVTRIAGHGEGEASSYAANLTGYFVPSSHLAILGRLRHDGGSSFGSAEHVVYFGYSIVALALVGIWLLVRRPHTVAANGTLAFTVRTAAIAFPLAVLLSLPPEARIIGISLPLPSAALGHLTSFYRVYARFGVTAALAAALLAAAAIDALRRSHPRVASALVGLVLVELWPGVLPTWQTTARPIDRSLARLPAGIVANYPQPTDQVAATTLALQEQAYQPQNGHPLYTLLSGGTADTREQGIRILSRYITDPDAPGILAAEHVRYVVLHDDAYRAEGTAPPPAPAGFRNIGRVGDARIYRLTTAVAPVNLDQVLEQRAAEVAAVQGLEAPRIEPGAGLGAEITVDGERGWHAVRGEAHAQVVATDNRLHRFTLLVRASSVHAGANLRIEAGGLSGTYAVGMSPTQFALGPLPIAPGPIEVTLEPSTGAEVKVALSAQPLADYSVSLARVR